METRPQRPEACLAKEEIKLDVRGQITAPLGGENYVLRPSEEAILAIEDETGLSLFDLAGQAANGRMSLRHMGIVVAAMMRAHGKANPEDPLITTYMAANPDKIRGLILEAGTPRIMARITVILAGAIGGGYTASGEVKAATGTN